jgi:magnesium chelatase subunit D
VSLQTDILAEGASGRRRSDAAGEQKVVGTRVFDGTGSLSVNASIGAAAMRGARLGAAGVPLERSDLKQHERRGKGASRVLFVVDASGSMGVEQRLKLAGALLAGLLESSYQQRDEVGMMIFRGQGTELVLPFTRDVSQAEAALRDVPTGGRTPLATALLDAARLLATRAPSLLVLLTDGRANIALQDGDPWQDALNACATVRDACAGALVIDCETGPVSLGRAQQLAQRLDAECVRLGAVEAGELVLQVQSRLVRS